MKDPKKPMSPIENQTGGGDQLSQQEAELDQTRHAIKEDLQALGQRLTPEHLKQDAKDMMTGAKDMAKDKAVEKLHDVKDAATNRLRGAKDTAVETVSAKMSEFRHDVRHAEQETFGFVRQNALPLALLGIGAYWLYSNTSRQRRDTEWEGRYRPLDHYPPRDEYGPADMTSSGELRESARRGFEEATEGAREMGEQASHRARQWMDRTQHRASEVAERARHGASGEASHLQHSMREAGRKVSHAASKARDSAGRELREARDYSMRVSEAHPLAVGAAALTAGLGLGLLLPQTQREGEVLGRRRDRMMGEAKEAVQEWGHAAKEAARDAKETIGGATRH